MTTSDPAAVSGGRLSPPTGGYRSGIVCLAGRPNVGKSTLLNHMVGAKLAIVTEVPGTTRNTIRGVVTREDAQLAFVDTPGLLKPRTLLNRRTNELVLDTWRGVDVVCLMVDAAAGIGRGDGWIAARLAEVDVPAICVVNKHDRLSREQMLKTLLAADELGEFVEIVPTSATTGYNVEHLVDLLVGYLPEGPLLFPAEMRTDQPERTWIAELIREAYLRRLREEVPHSVAVVVDDVVEQPDGGPGRAADGAGDQTPLVEIFATVYVERESQKAIVIGRGGRMLEQANTAARRELERLLGPRVFLDVRVKVAEDWQSDPRHLERFGY